MKRNNILKTTFVIVLALALILSLTACGGGTALIQQAVKPDAPAVEPDESAKEGAQGGGENFMIGYNTWGAGSSAFDWQASSIDYAFSVFGVTGTRVSDDHSADTELQNIQNFISSGVDGMLMATAVPPVLPQAAEAAKAAEIPFALYIFVGEAPDRGQLAATNPFYTGATTAAMVAEGYLIGARAIKDGHKTAVLIGGNIGDNHFEQRIEGFTKAFETEGGGKVLEIARCVNPGEGQEKASAMLSAHRDADCLYAMVGDYVPGSINAMETLGITGMEIYASHAGVETANYIKEGVVKVATAGNDLATVLSAAMLVNFLDGHPVTDDSGNAPELEIKPFIVDQSNVDAFMSIFYGAGVHPMTPESLKQLVWRYNPDVSYKTFTDLIDGGLSLEALLALH